MTRRASERLILRVAHPLIAVPRKRTRVVLLIMPVVFGAFCFAYLALRSVFPLERLSLALLSASLVGITLSLVSLTANDRVGLVRIAKTRPLRFTPSPAYEYWFFASAALWGLSSMLALFHWVSTGIPVFGTSQGRGDTLFAPLLIASGLLFVGWRVARIFRKEPRTRFVRLRRHGPCRRLGSDRVLPRPPRRASQDPRSAPRSHGFR